MANTFSQIYIHIIFAVQGRESQISKTWKQELNKYICGIVKNQPQKIYSINGVSNHIHFLISIKPNCNLSDLIKEIKVNSTKWINLNKFVRGKFQWQQGFGCFSVSPSQLDTVIKYIDNQEIHHQKLSFKEEYMGFLKAYNIEFDEKYVFDWIE